MSIRHRALDRSVELVLFERLKKHHIDTSITAGVPNRHLGACGVGRPVTAYSSSMVAGVFPTLTNSV